MSNLILGGVGFAKLDRKTADRLLACANDIGISGIDTAPTYGDSEEIIGSSQRIKDWKVSTKLGSPNGPNLSKKYIVQSVESSLRKLNRSDIHTCFIHSLPQANIDEVLIETLTMLKNQGKIQYIGYSGDGKDLNLVLTENMVDAVMATLNILDLSNLETIRNFGNQSIYLKRILGNGVFRIRPRLELIDLVKRLREDTPLDTDSYKFRFQTVFGSRSLIKDYPELFFSFLLSLGLKSKYVIGTTDVWHLRQIRKIEEEMHVWQKTKIDEHSAQWTYLSAIYRWAPLV